MDEITVVVCIEGGCMVEAYSSLPNVRVVLRDRDNAESDGEEESLSAFDQETERLIREVAPNPVG